VRSGRLRLIGLILVFGGAVPSAARPQQATFSAGTLGVRVDVLVTHDGKPVTGLQASDFVLRDSLVPQTIDVAEASDLPLNVLLAFDASASTAGAGQADLVTATRALLAGLRPGDRVALTTFSEAVRLDVPLTSNFGAISAALQHVTPGGNTALLDGVYTSLVSTLTEPARSLVVVCTDGRDTASWLEPQEVLEAAKRSNAVIYAVASGAAQGWSTLKDLTSATGGQTIDVASGADRRATFEAILLEFRRRYVITYVPANVPSGGFHPLDIRVRRGGARVTARPGYIGAQPGGGE
jgi:VWFA-related protein